MKDGPDIAIVASLMGNPARANIMAALIGQGALSAAELAREAGIAASTAAEHLNKLTSAGLLTAKRQGRHRFFSLAETDVAEAVEALAAVAARAGHLRARPGPKDSAMRHARSCYDHLAGRVAVDLFAEWRASSLLAQRGGALSLTGKGRAFLMGRGLDVSALARGTRPLCRACMDWSEKRHHLAGSLGAEILKLVLTRGWARRDPKERTLYFSNRGEENFSRWYSPGVFSP